MLVTNLSMMLIAVPFLTLIGVMLFGFCVQNSRPAVVLLNW